MSDVPKVALLIETARGYGRQMLRGIVHYARLQRCLPLLLPFSEPLSLCVEIKNALCLAWRQKTSHKPEKSIRD